MSEPTILIQFDRETWLPLATFPNGETDIETAKLLEIADMMLKALPSLGAEPFKEPGL